MKVTPFDVVEYLESDEDIAVFLDEAFQTGDSGYIAHAIGVVARAKGMTALSQKTGIAREQLYRCLSGQGNPTLKTMFTVLEALDIKLAVSQHGAL